MSTTEYDQDGSAAEQAKRDYNRHVRFAKQDLGEALSPENTPIRQVGHLDTALVYATLAQAAATRLQAEQLAAFTTAVHDLGVMVREFLNGLQQAMAPLLAAAERVAHPPVTVDDETAMRREFGGE